MARGFVTAQTQLAFNAVTTVGAFATTIANVVEAPGGGATKAKIDATAISDTADVSIGGTVENQPVTFTIMFDPTDANHQSLVSIAQTSGTVSDLQIKYPQVNANCKAVNVGGFFEGGGVPAHELRGGLKMTFTYKPNGAWTWTYA